MNTGDDSFCAVSAWGANHYWKTKDIRFLCRKLPNIPVTAKAALANRRIFRGQGFFETVYQLTSTPALVFSGGSIFHSELRGMNTGTLISEVQRLRHFKIGAIGVSLGPYRSDQARRSIEGYLSRFSFLVLRDRRSFEEACSINLPFSPIEGFDLAALLPQVYGTSEKREGLSVEVPTLGVSVCHSERYLGSNIDKERRREALVLETLTKISQAMPIKIQFFVFNGEPPRGDDELTNKMAEVLEPQAKVEIIPYSNNPGATWRKLAYCDAVFSTRLHGGIFACVAEVPFLLVEYHQKCSDFLKGINCPAQWRIGDMEVSTDYATKILKEMLACRMQSYPIDIQPLADKAALNFTSICN